MKTPVGEQLSALMDDELDAAELELVLRRLKTDDEVRGKWCRYHLANEGMRNGLPENIDLDLGDRIRRAVESEPAHASGKAAVARWSRPKKGLAVAASLLLVVATGSMVMTDRGEQPLPVVSETTADTPQLAQVAPETETAGVVVDRWDPAASREVYPYLANHSQLSASGGIRPVLPYARMIGYESAQ